MIQSCCDGLEWEREWVWKGSQARLTDSEVERVHLSPHNVTGVERQVMQLQSHYAAKPRVRVKLKMLPKTVKRISMEGPLGLKTEVHVTLGTSELQTDLVGRH